MAKTLEEKTTLPYASRKDTIKIFKLIHKREEPKIIDQKSLKINGIGSPTYVILMLKNLKIIDDQGNLLKEETADLRKTAEAFKSYLMEMLKSTYKDLFDRVPEPLLLENEDKVKNFFVHHYTDVRKDMLNKLINCFLALRDIVNGGGDFASLEIKELTPKKKITQIPEEKSIGKTKHIKNLSKPKTKDIVLQLNLNINIDVETSKEAIEKLFKNISVAHQTVFGDNK